MHSEPGGTVIGRQPVHQGTRVSLHKTRTLKWSYWVSMTETMRASLSPFWMEYRKICFETLTWNPFCLICGFRGLNLLLEAVHTVGPQMEG